MFICPTDLNTGKYALTNAAGMGLAEAQTSSYTANFGRDLNIAKFPDSGNGMFIRNRSIDMREVIDGSGQTILIGERGSILTQEPWGGAINGGICKVAPNSPSNTPKTKTAPVQALGHADTGGGTNTRLFWETDDFFSPHPAGICFLMGDGSVHFIKSTIHPSVDGGSFSTNLGEVLSANSY